MIPSRYNRLGASKHLRRLSYIESTGTQYIDTGVSPDFANGDELEVSFYAASYSGNDPCVFGSRQSPAINGFYVISNVRIVVCDSDGFSAINKQSGPGDFTFKVNNSRIVVNNSEVEMPKRVTCAFPMYIFQLNNNGRTISPYSGAKLYDWKYYHDGSLAQHLVPALLRGVPGLWDTVSRTFLTNSGTGTFNYA